MNIQREDWFCIHGPASEDGRQWWERQGYNNGVWTSWGWQPRAWTSWPDDPASVQVQDHYCYVNFRNIFMATEVRSARILIEASKRRKGAKGGRSGSWLNITSAKCYVQNDPAVPGIPIFITIWKDGEDLATIR